MPPKPDAPTTLQTLLDERQRLEAWLASLAAKHDATPATVYQRVHADYTARLTAVATQIAARKAEAQDALAALTERLAALQREETALHEERYEAEVRAGVGEFTPAKWTEFLRQNESRVAAVAAERARVSGEVVTLRQALGGADAVRPARGAGPAGEAAPPRSGSPGFDELAFLKSVVDTRDGSGGAGRASAATASAPPVGRAASHTPAIASVPPVLPGYVPSGAPLRETAPTAAGPAPETVPPAGPASNTVAQTNPYAVARPDPAPAAGEPISEEATRAVSDTGNVPAFLRGVPREQQRTLKCRSCQALNFSTEWYCEKCGAELAGV